MKEIKLTREQVALVDDADFDWLNQWKWSAHRQPKGQFVAVRNIKRKGKSNIIYMHRLIMSTPKGMQVDHIDHNSLNNQRYNLRNCTQQQNAFNKKLLRKYKGVFKCPCSNNFYAKIKFKRKQIYLGVSNNEIDAAHAYDRAAIKYFGEFACLNFPEEKGLRLKEMENER